MFFRKSTLFNIVFAGNCLLLFLLAAETHIVVPAWLQVAGRMHPLVLHFPVVLLLLSILWELGLFRRGHGSEAYHATGDILLLATAATATLAALMGLLLSKEEGYEGNILLWHKWGGALLAFACMAWYSFRKNLRNHRSVRITSALVATALLIITGHQGATITHGENFLTGPVSSTSEQPVIAFEDALVFDHLVKPVLETKCTGCHNASKAKGELVMETPAGLLKGGKNGILWDTTAKDFGLMMQRIHLAVDNKKHMPPKGKPQLTEEEISILYHWIRSGSNMQKRLSELDPTDSLRILAANRFSTDEQETYTFAAADEAAIRELNSHYRVISPLAAGSPALQVNFFGAAAYDGKQLNELLPLKDQIVHINLNRMPVKDKELEVLSKFPEIRQLNLSFSHITDSGLTVLRTMKRLQQLAVSGTRITARGLEQLSGLPALQQLYCWNTGLTEADIRKLRKANKSWRLESGFGGEGVIITLNPPAFENEEQVLKGPAPLQLKHYVKDVEMRYTTDGTEPDSLHSRLYNDNATIDRAMVIKARAFKKGWVGSHTSSREFYMAGKKPSNAELRTSPDKTYKGNGPSTLFDLQKGDLNFRTPKWLGYQGRPMVLELKMDTPEDLSAITLAMLVDVGSHIFPPEEIRVMGGSEPGTMQLLGSLRPIQPTKDTSAYQASCTVPLKKQPVKYLELVVTPKKALPRWHIAKGEKAWIFMDELFIY